MSSATTGATPRRRKPGRSNLPSEAVLLKERQALELRRAKATYTDIAQALGYASPSGAYRAVQSALKRTAQGAAEEYRAEELDMLDRLHRAHWTRALAGDVAAAKLVLSVSERRSKLMGLDAAIAIKATVTDAVDAQIEELVAELAQLASGE